MSDKDKECSGCGGGCGGHGEEGHECGALASGHIHSVDPVTGIFVESEALDGLMHGMYSEYFDIEGEQLKIQGSYDKGVKQGIWSEFDKTGTVLKVEIFDKGVLLEKRTKL
ncbi:MAG: hypothetical protein WCJ46_07560 [bacterium]